MSLVDLGRWADALIAEYGDRAVNGNALFPFSSFDPDDIADIEELLVPMDRHPAQRILQVTVIGRGGGTASRIRWPDGSVIDPGPPGSGRVLDAPRAAMRRPAAA
ncbi:MAG: hypothetical protein V7636_2588 [Actinomycetota bacterium]|jgi:hypothetical protein